MIAALHQPNFLPWLGFFHKMAMADVLILLDNVQITKSWAARNLIKTRDGVEWLRMQYRHVGVLQDRTYRNTHVLSEGKWFKKLWEPIHHAYCRAPYYDLYADGLHTILAEAGGRALADINRALIAWAASELGIGTLIVYQSELSITAARWDLPIEVCKAIGADTYLSGQGGAKSYNQPELFGAAGIELRYQEFNHPIYPQLWSDFVPGMAVIDLLFNCGLEAGRILLNG